MVEHPECSAISDEKKMARLLSINVGLPRDIPWQGRTVHTGVWKTPVQGRRMVRRLNIDGDGQGDLQGHGGEHRAVFVYQIESYRYWQTQLGRNDFVHGQFGENFTIDGLPDSEVCIGDRYRIGSALFEVTQPRVTCYRVGIRMKNPQMPALLVAHHRPGFYFRVLEEGEVEAGDGIVKVLGGPEGMSVVERRLALLIRNVARTRTPRRLDGRQSRLGAHRSVAAGMGRVSAASRNRQTKREQQCHLARARAKRRPPACRSDARAVHRAATEASVRRARVAAQLFAVRRTEREALADQHQARAERRRRILRRD
jgi:MOSC domain-containing protein YiiM